MATMISVELRQIIKLTAGGTFRLNDDSGPAVLAKGEILRIDDREHLPEADGYAVATVLGDLSGHKNAVVRLPMFTPWEKPLPEDLPPKS